MCVDSIFRVYRAVAIGGPGSSLFKGQLISKANCQAVDSPKKRTNEFAFFDLKSCYVVKSNAVLVIIFSDL